MGKSGWVKNNNSSKEELQCSIFTGTGVNLSAGQISSSLPGKLHPGIVTGTSMAGTEMPLALSAHKFLKPPHSS